MPITAAATDVAEKLIALAQQDTPQARARLAAALRGALWVVEGRTVLALPPRMANAIEGLAATLSMAADHAEAIADAARLIRQPPG